MSFQNNELFKVLKQDGTEWTSEEIKKYFQYFWISKSSGFNNDRVLMSTDLEPYISDWSGATLPADPEYFKVVWNKEKLLDILESGECE